MRSAWETLVINLLVGGVDIAVILLASRARRFVSLPILYPVAAVVVGWIVIHAGGFGFYSMQLLAYVCFLHGPVVLFAGAWLERGSPRARRFHIGAAVLLLGLAVDMFVIEPRRLQLIRYRVESPKLSRTLTVGILADLQTDRIGAHERRALRMLMSEKPDLILLPGDFLQIFDPEPWPRERTAFKALLRESGLAAPLGVYAVKGNAEGPRWPLLFAESSVRCLDQTTRIELREVTLTGLELYESFATHTNIRASDKFHIAFGHAPDFAFGRPPADLLVAGHTHGGQVWIPFFGPLITLSLVPRSWAAGRTDLENGSVLIVSRGVGMERGNAPRLRFLCPPEIVIVDLVPKVSVR